jgi:D-glycero-alpha-D-manno-heptose-7-phosphate kinase
VAYGGFNYYQFNYDESVYIDPIICKQETKKQLEENLMFFYTGISRQSSTVLTEQKANIPNKERTLDELVDMVSIVRKSLQQNELSEIGTQLNRAWELKKSLASNISNPAIDDMYERAREAGALGGKILGAGGGGFLMVYAEKDAQEKVRQALKAYQEHPMRFDGEGSKIIYIND